MNYGEQIQPDSKMGKLVKLVRAMRAISDLALCDGGLHMDAELLATHNMLSNRFVKLAEECGLTEADALTSVSRMIDNDLYDLWMNGRWIGMSHGATPQDARQKGVDSLGCTVMNQCVMTPFFGCGTSDQTYTAIMGKKPT